MFRSRATAAADDADAVVHDKMLMIFREFSGRELVNGVSAHVLRQSGIWKHRNFLRRIERQVADGVVHLLGSGRTIQTNRIDFKRLERSKGCPYFRAQEHSSGFLQRDLHLHGQALASLPHRLQYADGRDLGLQ